MKHRAGRRSRQFFWCAALVVPAIASFGFNVAGAAAQPPDSAYAACMAKANSTRDMQMCQAAGLAAAESRFRTAYAQALAALPPDQQAELSAAQRRWLAFRHSDCQVFYGKTTGTFATIGGGSCMIDRTRERIRELRGFILDR